MDSACRILRLRRVALATSFVSAAVRSPKSFLCNRNEVSYYIKKPYLKSPLRYGTRWKYTAEPALQGMEYVATPTLLTKPETYKYASGLFHRKCLFSSGLYRRFRNSNKGHRISRFRGSWTIPSVGTSTLPQRLLYSFIRMISPSSADPIIIFFLNAVYP